MWLDLATENHKSGLPHMVTEEDHESGLLSPNEEARGQDALHRWARRPGWLDRDANYILPSMQTDQNRRFTSPVCVGPLKMPLEHG
jgi:hypothetical protein